MEQAEKITLRVVPAEGEPYDLPLAGDSMVIGRSSSVDLPLVDRFLSRRHARIFRRGNDVYVEDLGSRNGTMLNGAAVTEPSQLKPGDVIQLSGSVITLEQAAAGPVTTLGAYLSTTAEGTILRHASELLPEGRLKATTDHDTGALKHYADRLKLLNEVHHALGRSLQLNDLLELILDRAFDHLRPEQGTIYLRSADGELRRSAVRSAGNLKKEFLYSRTLIREVTEKGLAALVLDVETDERFAEAHSILSSGVRSLVAAPLLDAEGCVGMIVLHSNAAVRRFSEEDLELLVSLASVAALRIRNVALAEEAAERRLLEEELVLARRIQVALLPDTMPDLPGYELYGGNIPSRGASGDFFQVVERGEGRECVFVIADVSGKGIAASLLTASLEALSAAPIEDGQPPEEICNKLSRLLYRRTTPEKYATAVLAALEAATGRLRFTNAGHNPVLIVRSSGEVDTLGATGVPIGLMPMAVYEAGETELAPGDVLVLYTDGLVEATGPDEEEFGLERLQRVCVEHRHAALESMAKAITESLEEFAQGVPFADDRTLVMIRRQPQS